MHCKQLVQFYTVEKKTRFEGCDQGRVVSQRRNRNTEVKNSLFKTKKKLVFVKNKKETQQSLHADVGPCVCKQRIDLVHELSGRAGK